MADEQPPNIVEGATTGDVEDEVAPAAKSAEDRKAAAAMSSMDAKQDDEGAASKDLDHAAIRKAMDRLTGVHRPNGTQAKKVEPSAQAKAGVAKKPVVKLAAADVAMVVEHLELSKAKASDLLKLHDGDISKALKAYINPVA